MKNLITLERRLRASSGKTDELRMERDAAILEALAEGFTQADIARALDLTTARVNQIAKREAASA